MKKISFVVLAVLATAGAVCAQVDPTRPMLTGRGNVNVHLGRVIITHQTAAKSEEPAKLEEFVVTGSLIRPPAKVTPKPKA